MKKICLILAVALLAACSSKSDDPHKEEFVKGCMDSDMEYEVCSCTYDKLMGKYSAQDLKRLEINPASLPPDFLDDMARSTMICSGMPVPELAPRSTPAPAAAPAAPAVTDQPVAEQDYLSGETGEAQLAPGAQEMVDEAKAAEEAATSQ